jgi:hypothetical protein
VLAAVHETNDSELSQVSSQECLKFLTKVDLNLDDIEKLSEKDDENLGTPQNLLIHPHSFD